MKEGFRDGTTEWTSPFHRSGASRPSLSPGNLKPRHYRGAAGAETAEAPGADDAEKARTRFGDKLKNVLGVASPVATNRGPRAAANPPVREAPAGHGVEDFRTWLAGRFEPASGAAGETAARALAQRLVAIPAPDDVWPTQYGVTIASALGKAGVTSVEQATRVLDAIRDLDLPGDACRTAGDHRDATRDQAWHCVRQLAGGTQTDGRQALWAFRMRERDPHAGADDRLPNEALGIDGARDEQAIQKERVFAVLMSSLDALSPLPHADGIGAHSQVPGDVYARIRGPGSRIAERESDADAAFQAAEQYLRDGANALTDAERATLGYWQSGVLSQKAGGAKERVQGRLGKAQVWADRIGQSAWKSMGRVAGVNKSPFRSLKLDTSNATRHELVVEQTALSDTIRSIGDQGFFSELIGPGGNERGDGEVRALWHKDPVRSMALLAALDVWLSSGGFQGGRVSRQEAAEIDRRTMAYVDRNQAVLERRLGMQPGDRYSSSRKKLNRQVEKALREIEKTKFTADFLGTVGAQFGMANGDLLVGRARAQNESGEARNDGGQDDVGQNGSERAADVRKSLGQLVEDVRAKEFPAGHKLDAKASSPEEVREFLIGQIRNFRPGALAVGDGSRTGAAIDGLSIMVNNAAHLAAVPLSVQPRARYAYGREAAFEVARTLHGMEIFVGTRKRHAGGVGVGVLGGYKLELHNGMYVRAAGEARGEYEGESEERVGALIHVSRNYGEADSDARMIERAEAVIRKLIPDERSADAQDDRASVADGIARMGFDTPEIRLEWLDSKRKTHGWRVTGTAVAGANVLPDHDDSFLERHDPQLALTTGVSVGTSLGGRVRKEAPASPGDAKQQSVQNYRKGKGAFWTGQAGLAAVPSGIPGMQMSDGVQIGVFSTGPLAVSRTFYDGYSAVRLRMSKDVNGRYDPRLSHVDLEFASHDAFKAHLKQNWAQWKDLQDEREASNAGGAAQGGQVRAHLRPEDFLSGEGLAKRSNQTYIVRYQLHRDAARHFSFNEALRANGDDGALSEANLKLLDDPGMWLPSKLLITEQKDKTQDRGLNLVFNVAARSTMSSSRDLLALRGTRRASLRVKREATVGANAAAPVQNAVPAQSAVSAQGAVSVQSTAPAPNTASIRNEPPVAAPFARPAAITTGEVRLAEPATTRAVAPGGRVPNFSLPSSAWTRNEVPSSPDTTQGTSRPLERERAVVAQTATQAQDEPPVAAPFARPVAMTTGEARPAEPATTRAAAPGARVPNFSRRFPRTRVSDEAPSSSGTAQDTSPVAGAEAGRGGAA
ncbi:hypothetical protein CY652_03895 [Burkholderia sp. WAC0059]|uniref:hypothetical protein n=1 Tax=Burkholderia sp. WAC0059 TaxID=2066022 RepID=UPI000C7E9873|nr:hypothetical protein [Burkholderia sp. WAC0059]PLZ03544.1 hypothetical protein CY652_03895 [Burkholderia sp. WAC0059]